MGTDQRGKELGKGISQRPDGLYTARFTDHTGKRRQKYFKKLAECRQWLADAQFTDEHSNIFMDDITVDAWYQYWIDNIKGDTIRHNTRKMYDRRYSHDIQPLIGQLMIKEVKPLHCQHVLNHMVERPYANSTIGITKLMMTMLFASASDNDIINKSPVRNLTIKNGKPSKKPRVLTIEEQKKFLETAQKYLYYDHYAFLLQTGLRVGELQALQWSDIDFQQNKIYIRHALVKAETGHVLGEPKTKSGFRSIPLTQNAKEILNRQKAWRAQLKIIPLEYSDTVFLNTKGKKTDKAAYTHKLYKICDKINIPRISMHTLRHTFATRCIEGGMKPKTLQKIMGHSRIETTMNLYVHITEDEKIKEMKNVEAALKVV